MLTFHLPQLSGSLAISSCNRFFGLQCSFNPVMDAGVIWLAELDSVLRPHTLTYAELENPSIDGLLYGEWTGQLA